MSWSYYMLIGRILYQEVEEKAVVSLQPTRLPNCQTQSESNHWIFLRTPADIFSWFGGKHNRSFKSTCDVFLALTQCFLCLNLTRAQSQCCENSTEIKRNLQSGLICGFAEFWWVGLELELFFSVSLNKKTCKGTLLVSFLALSSVPKWTNFLSGQLCLMYSGELGSKCGDSGTVMGTVTNQGVYGNDVFPNSWSWSVFGNSICNSNTIIYHYNSVYIKLYTCTERNVKQSPSKGPGSRCEIMCVSFKHLNLSCTTCTCAEQASRYL